MEPRAGAEEAAVRRMSFTALFDGRGWMRVAAGCLLLAGLAFIQSPGYLVGDTKFDLVADPAGFLGRALHLWDPEGFFGQLQNQAYGYLWPMGPFFLLGDLLGLPGWVTQRLWLILVFSTAFAGAAVLARALGVRSDFACLLAGFAYALSPRMLSIVGPISIEAWPSAMAPWVLVPLVLGASSGSPRRAAALAGCAVGMVGGVNAAATFAVIPLGVVWILTRASGRRRTSLLLWWPAFTAVATAWWLVPLFLLGAYSPPFLNYIESASITTFPTTIVDAVRGTSAWVPYIDDTWRGGSSVIRHGFLALNSALVVMLGLIGLMMPRNPHRRFLALGLAVGLLMVTFGHTGAVEGWMSGSARDLLDGILAPLRNVHKFDPIVRLPLVLGLAWFCDAALRSGAGERAPRRNWGRAAYAGIAALALAGSTVPVVMGGLSPARPVVEVPDYWEEAADWLADQDDSPAASLLVPGSGSADYLWGAPRDEPLQYLAESPWAVRNAIPLTSAGSIRMLDGIEQSLANGHGSVGVQRALARAGVRYLVLRNDLRAGAEDASPVQVQQALEDMPGVELVASFGPDSEGALALEADQARYVSQGGWRSARPAVEIYAVDDVASAVSGGDAPVVVGGAEDLPDLLGADLLGTAPAQMAYDVDEEPVAGPVVLTDGFVARQRFFGRVHHASSSASVPGDVNRTGNPTLDYLPDGSAEWRSRATLRGATAIRASSSMSDAEAFERTQPGQQPYAAVDDDLETQWVSGVFKERPAWWSIDLSEEVDLDGVDVRLGVDSSALRVRARSDQGAGTPVAVDSLEAHRLDVPAGPTRTITVEVVGTDSDQLALADVSWPERGVGRPLVLPEVPTDWGAPRSILLRSMLGGAVSGCLRVEDRTPCLEERVVQPEEWADMERVVKMPAPESYEGVLTARPRPGAALDALVMSDAFVSAQASSVGVLDTRGGALAAIDGDAGTAWTARMSDPVPQLVLRWLRPAAFRTIQLDVPVDAPVRRPTLVSLEWPGGQEAVTLDPTGLGRLSQRVRTDELSIKVVESESAASVDSDGDPSGIPPGVAEVRLDGDAVSGVPLSDAVQTLPCGTGPRVTVNARTWVTALRASTRQLYEGATVPAIPCQAGRPQPVDAYSLVPGDNVMRAESSPTAILDSFVLEHSATRAEALPADVVRHSASDLSVDPPKPGVLAVRQNYNPGWVAQQNGDALEPVVVDGWQQGWVLRDDSVVSASFAPDGLYRAGLLSGLVLFVALVASVLVRRFWVGARWPSVGTGEGPWAPVLAAGMVAWGGLLAGWGGAIVALLCYVAAAGCRRLPQSTVDELIWIAALPAAVAVGAYFIAPWGGSAWAGRWAWPHYLMLVSVAVTVGLSGSRGRRPRRIAGRSMSR